jgi:hypothetical protein
MLPSRVMRAEQARAIRPLFCLYPPWEGRRELWGRDELWRALGLARTGRGSSGYGRSSTLWSTSPRVRLPEGTPPAPSHQHARGRLEGSGLPRGGAGRPAGGAAVALQQAVRESTNNARAAMGSRVRSAETAPEARRALAAAGRSGPPVVLDCCAAAAACMLSAC